MWFVLFLSVFHSFLLCTNQTTHEYLKKIWKTAPGNPYSYQKFLFNILRVIFRPPLPEHFDKQFPVNLAFDTYTICPSKCGFVKSEGFKSGYDKVKTNGLNSRNIEKVEDSVEKSEDYDYKGAILLKQI